MYKLTVFRRAATYFTGINRYYGKDKKTKTHCGSREYWRG